jgi:hypothetical protein
MMNMRTLSGYIMIISLLFITGACYHAQNPVPVCRVQENKLVFRLDNRWDNKQMKETALLYDLDTVVLIKAFRGEKKFVVNNVNWRVKKIDSHYIDLYMPIENTIDSLIAKGLVYMFNGGFIDDKLQQNGPSDKYGINIFLHNKTFIYKDDEGLFWLPGHKDAGNVYLSGSFNSWNTSDIPMEPCDSGWTARVKLIPGKYAYKFIIDGNWTQDPFNLLKENDFAGGFNSVIYCPNHLFKINGRKDASEIRVTGDFMNWDTTGLKMTRSNTGWILPIYLREGKYQYKFISGHEWFTDPENPDITDDGSGNMNSYITIGIQKTFNLKDYTEASSVILTGTFNNWDRNELKMKKTDNGWTVSYAFPAGNYEYKFLVDGNWIIDPSNENTTGSGGFTNSLFFINPNHTFILENHRDAKEVMVTGSFNGFRNPGYRMSEKDGKWVITLYLKPGKTIYKFIVDGEWILDPANELWEENEYGTGNSVLWN